MINLLVELDVGGIDILAELKPRSGSHKFKMTVASLFLRECCTKSVVISPHPFAPSQVSRSLSGTRLRSSSGERDKNVGGVGSSSSSRDPIFSVLYERKPSKRFGHRIIMTTRPLDLIFFPKIWDDINIYFTVFDNQPGKHRFIEF